MVTTTTLFLVSVAIAVVAVTGSNSSPQPMPGGGEGDTGAEYVASPSHPQPVYTQPVYPQPIYGYYPQPQPLYHPQATYLPQPTVPPGYSYHYQQPSAIYQYQPVYSHDHHPEPTVPACATNTTKPWCLEDAEYPTYEIKHAIEYNAHHVLAMYSDVAGLSTVVSVARPKTLEEETYLCPSVSAYVRPLRAINTDGKWRVIVNDIDVHYQTLSQSARLEECLTAPDEACPLVPFCYQSKCLQKSIYHRFLVYDPYDYYLPFAIETFKLPASCACLLGAYTIDH